MISHRPLLALLLNLVIWFSTEDGIFVFIFVDHFHMMFYNFLNGCMVFKTNISISFLINFTFFSRGYPVLVHSWASHLLTQRTNKGIIFQFVWSLCLRVRSSVLVWISLALARIVELSFSVSILLLLLLFFFIIEISRES